MVGGSGRSRSSATALVNTTLVTSYENLHSGLVKSLSCVDVVKDITLHVCESGAYLTAMTLSNLNIAVEIARVQV